MGFFKALPRLSIVFLGLLTALVVASLLVNLIPGERIYDNVSRTAPTSNYERSQIGLSFVDSWTECIAASLGVSERARAMPVVTRLALSPTIGNCEQIQAYRRGAMTVGLDYWRYWHGYQILSRPILYLSDIWTLRAALFALYVMSFLTLVSRVTIIDRRCGLALAISLFAGPIVDRAPNLPHALVWIVAFSAGALAAWRAKPDPRSVDAIFLATGVVCAFVDLFTTPLVSLTIPLIVLYWKGVHQPGEARLTARRIVILCGLWLAGYALCWSSKWVLAGVVGRVDVLGELSSIIQHRLGTGGGPMGDEGAALRLSPLISLIENIRRCRLGIVVVCALMIARAKPLALALLAIRRREASAFMAPVLIFLLPMAWLVVVQQHSVWHAWFVAGLYFTSFALVIAALLNLSEPSRPKGGQSRLWPWSALASPRHPGSP